MSYETVLSSLPGFAADIIAKATVLLTAVVLIDFFLRQRSAALRHRIWATAFVGLLVLPILSFVIPEYRLAILPADWMAGDQVLANNDAKRAAAQESQPPSTTEALGLTSDRIASSPNPVVPMHDSRLPSSEPILATQQVRVAVNLPQPPVDSNAGDSGAARGAFSAIGIMGLVWTIGLFLTVSPLVLGIWRIVLLQRKSPVIEDLEPNNTLAELCRRLGILRAVRLLETEQSIVPMTWGMRSPVVLVPSTWRTWAVERRRLVLLHELAHVKRLDVVYQSIARVACSLYWFHPLAWFALKRLRIERELACDDCVLMAGERPSQYAEQLLTIAREYQSMEMPPAVAMAQRSGLENRVRAMLDQARSHLPLTPRVAVGMLVASVALLLLLAPIRLGAIAPTSVVPDTTEDSATVEKKSDINRIQISGVVTAPDNQPVAGARVTVLRAFLANTPSDVRHEKLLETTTDKDGRYQADVPAKSESFSNGFHFEEQRTVVLASKAGYGPDEVDIEASKGLCNLQLATTSKTLQGRLLDLEGKPIQGINVKLVKIEKAGAPIQTWLEQAKSNPATLNDPRMTMAQPVGAINWPRPAFFPSRGQIGAIDAHGAIEAVSDSNGKFVLAGVGDDRQATLQIESPSIATALLHCVTHDMPSVNMPNMDPRFRVGRTFGAEFDYSAEPSQWIQGIVRDKQAGSPVSGVVVSLHQFGDSTHSVENFLQVTTDANGRYVLKGIPKPPEGSTGVNLRVLPSSDQPYFRSEKRVPKSIGLDPIDLDIALTPGIWIEGQVTDAKTKAPLAAMVAYYPSRENNYAKNHEKWRLDLTTMGDEDLQSTDSSGRFRVPGLPGPGVLRVVAANDMEYELSTGNPPGMQRPPQKYYHCDSAGNAMEELEIAHDKTSHQVDVALKPLKMRSIHVVDASGSDIVGYQMAGRLPVGRPTISGRGTRYWGQKPVDTALASFFPGDGPERDRPLMFLDAERKLGAVVPVKSIMDSKNESYRVTLLPTVKIKGKLLDGKGKALVQGYVGAGVGLTEFHGMFPNGNGGNTYTTTAHPKHVSFGYGALDAAGAFELTVPPGDGFSLVILGGQFNAVLFRDRQLLPGHTIDLGTIDLSQIALTVAPNNLPLERVENASAVPKEEDTKAAVDIPKKPVAQKADDTYVFQGKVLNPDGTPAAGASLHLTYYDRSRLPDGSIRPLATSNADGSFEIRTTPEGNSEFMGLVATKPGFGTSSVKLAMLFETTGKLGSKSMEGLAQRLIGMVGNDKTLQLVDDRPLTGRILTVEGTPVPGAQIRVREIWWNTKGNLDGWDKATTNSKADYYTLRNEAPEGMNGFQLPSIVPDVLSDSNGKFTLVGVGKERIAQLTISGPGIETTTVFARTRTGKTVRVPHQFGKGQFGLPDEVYYADGFDFVAAPSVPVEGRIIDDATGAPLSGFLVSAGQQVTFSGGGKSFISTVTDKDGRYTISGLSQSDNDTLFVVPPRGSRYLPLGVQPKIKGVLEAVKLDFKLKPVSLVRGQVLDKSTGKPISGGIQYSVFAKNPNFADHRKFSFANFHECRTDKEGRYEIAVLPGEGLISFMADDHQHYRRAEKYGAIGESIGSEMRMYETYPYMVNAADKHFVKEIQIDKNATDTELNIELSSGKSIGIRVVRANGESAPKAILNGATEPGGWGPTQDGMNELAGYYADQGRELFAYDPESHQAAYLKISGPQTKEITLTLQPAGSLRGRLVDKQGLALSSARFFGESIPEVALGDIRQINTTDMEGRFELRGFVPGYKHTVRAQRDGSGLFVVAKDIEVDPIKGLDLGDVVVDVKD
jgi:beta-lactamase regulating signal transducer with metallopeptidase domain/5-hydroxyisourate hydrolase-like protein (transthyretin family)